MTRTPLLAARLGRAAAMSLALFAIIVSTSTSAQSSLEEGRLAAFESASVLTSHPAARPMISVAPATGEFTARGVSLKQLIGYANDVPPSRVVGGPDWVESARFEIRAFPRGDLNAGGTGVTTDDVRPLVMGLLIDYFGIEVHIEEAPLETVFIDRVGDQPVGGPGGHLFERASRKED